MLLTRPRRNSKMASTDKASSNKPLEDAKSESSRPSLPANVSIFSPASPSASRALLGGGIFTRLTVSSSIEPSRLTAVLKASPGVEEDFCLTHGNAVLVFDAGSGREDDDGDVLKDAHHEHVRMVCLALRDQDMGLDIAGCVFDAAEGLKAGFQFDRLSDGAVMVVDLMTADEDEDDEDDEDDGLEGLLEGAEVVQ